MTRHTPRPYQLEACDAVFSAWGRGMRRPALVLPTGEGKTQVFAMVIERWLAENPGRRALVVAHRRELIDQAADRVRSHLPGVPVGVCMASRNDTLPRVIVGSVQTLASERRRAMLRRVGLIVVDEAHRAAADSYVRVGAHYGAIDREGWTPPAYRDDPAVMLGVTATMSRGDTRALGDVWEDVVYRRTIGQGMRGEGNGGVPTLCRARGVRVTVDDLDMRRLAVRQGDYADGALGRAIEESEAPKRIAEAYRELAADRQGVSFAPTVAAAGAIRDALDAEGFTAALVHGATPDRERSAVLDAFRAGDVQVLSNCGVFTEGTDLPMISCVVVARPTMQSGLYIQMVGRGLRLWPGKSDCLVMDVSGASRRHTLEARVELFGTEVAEEIEAESIDVDAAEELELIEPAEAGLTAEDFEPGSAGRLRYEVVDLFSGSDTAWAQTPRQVWYYPVVSGYVALVPGERGGLDVVHLDHVGVSARPVALGVASWAEAQYVAESAIPRHDRMHAPRMAWRHADRKTRAVAARLGLDVPTGASAGEVSAMLGAEAARRRIDEQLLPCLPWITYA